MLGAFYLGLPIGLARSKLKRIRGTNIGRSLERALAGASLVSGAALAVGEITGVSYILMVSSAALVLSMILLSSTVVSNRIVRLATKGAGN